jgi:hypothetical protein
MRKSITLRTARGGWRTGAAAIALGAALALTACGSDDEGADDSTENSASDDADTTSDDDADTEDEAEDDTEDEADSGSGDSGDYCDTLMAVGEDMLDASSAMTDPEGAAAIADEFRSVAAVAPSDIADDWNTLADGMELLGGLDMTDPDAMDELEDLDALTEASNRVSAHVEENCS